MEFRLRFAALWETGRNSDTPLIPFRGLDPRLMGGVPFVHVSEKHPGKSARVPKTRPLSTRARSAGMFHSTSEIEPEMDQSKRADREFARETVFQPADAGFLPFGIVAGQFVDVFASQRFIDFGAYPVVFPRLDVTDHEPFREILTITPTGMPKADNPSRDVFLVEILSFAEALAFDGERTLDRRVRYRLVDMRPLEIGPFLFVCLRFTEFRIGWVFRLRRGMGKPLSFIQFYACIDQLEIQQTVQFFFEDWRFLLLHHQHQCPLEHSKIMD